MNEEPRTKNQERRTKNQERRTKNQAPLEVLLDQGEQSPVILALRAIFEGRNIEANDQVTSEDIVPDSRTWWAGYKYALNEFQAELATGFLHRQQQIKPTPDPER